MAVETVEIQERYTKKAVRALKQEESELALYLKAMREKLEALMGEIKDNREQRKQKTEESVMAGNGLYLPGRIEGNGVSFLVDTGSGVSILAARTWRKWGHAEHELTRYWGRLCSVEGRALECLGRARLTVTLGTRVIEWSFIVAEIIRAHSAAVRGCRVLPRPLRNEKGTHGQASAVHHPLGHRGTGDNGRNSCGPGCGTGDAGTTHRHTSTSDRSDPWSKRNGDDRDGAWTIGALPSSRSS